MAFVVRVTRVGIENTDLGDNTITMEVSRNWYDARVAQGKTIVITKIADDGMVTAAVADCSVAGEVATCTLTFTGDAGGFSVFAVIAVVQEPTALPTATPTPGPTATPRPTPTSAAQPTATSTAAAPPTPLPPSVTATSTPVPEPTATSTPMPEPTATPTPVLEPTAMPTPASPAEAGGNSGLIIGIVLAAFVAGGTGTYLVLRRRSS